MPKKSSRYLRRYTDLSALIYLLSEQKITLLDPDSWDDTNDIHYLRVYREKQKLSSVLAICFTQARETYHHWRVFANGASGVCVWFKRAELLKAVNEAKARARTETATIRDETVTYLTLEKTKGKRPSVSELPFLKRKPFEDEQEFRIIYEARRESALKFEIEIPLSCIARITLSPWVHHALFTRIKKMLECFLSTKSRKQLGIEIRRSTIRGNLAWKKFAESAM